MDVLDTRIFVGEFPFTGVVKAFLLGKKVIKFWCGSDALLMLEFPPGRGKLSVLRYRLKMRLLAPLISGHWFNGHGLFQALAKFGFEPAQVNLWVGQDQVFEKEPHEGFNVVYYAPTDSVYGYWVYGVDIIDQLIPMFPEFNWIKLNGKNAMSEVWPTADVYIRPSRWDGYPRLVREARLNGVDVIFSEKFDLTVEHCALTLKIIYAAHQQPSALSHS